MMTASAWIPNMYVMVHQTVVRMKWDAMKQGVHHWEDFIVLMDPSVSDIINNATVMMTAVTILTKLNVGLNLGHQQNEHSLLC
jgi:hypothetical protein